MGSETKSQREKRKDTITMKFLCSMAMFAMILISLTIVESGIILHRNDVVTPVESVNEKTLDSTSAESNSTRLSSPYYPEAFRLYKGIAAVRKHAWKVSPKGTKVILHGPAG